jgi:hypothetical protein
MASLRLCAFALYSEYAAPDGACFVLGLGSTKMPRLRRWLRFGTRVLKQGLDFLGIEIVEQM